MRKSPVTELGRSRMERNASRMLKSIRYRYLLLPVPVSLVLAAAVHFGFWTVSKPTLENTAVVSLIVFLLIALFRYHTHRSAALSWSIFLLAALLMREIHFSGTTTGVYVAMLLLLYVALRNFDQYTGFLDHPKVTTGLALAFSTYFLSVTLDQRWWRGLPGEAEAHVTLEESLEILGHLLVGFSLMLGPSRRKRPAPHDDVG